MKVFKLVIIPAHIGINPCRIGSRGKKEKRRREKETSIFSGFLFSDPLVPT
jgi:hypothetical protein